MCIADMMVQSASIRLHIKCRCPYMEALELCESGLEQIISCPLPIMNLTNSQFKIYPKIDFSPLSFRTANRSEPSSVTIFPVLAVLKLRKNKLLKLRKYKLLKVSKYKLLKLRKYKLLKLRKFKLLKLRI